MKYVDFTDCCLIIDEIRQYAEDNDIGVMDGDDLVELIIDYLDVLSVGAKRALGISLVPHIIS